LVRATCAFYLCYLLRRKAAAPRLERNPIHVNQVHQISAEITDGFHARRVIRDCIDFYNEKRSHTALGRRTPDEAFGKRETEKLAA